jgi:hypothetical protein
VKQGRELQVCEGEKSHTRGDCEIERIPRAELHVPIVVHGKLRLLQQVRILRAHERRYGSRDVLQLVPVVTRCLAPRKHNKICDNSAVFVQLTHPAAADTPVSRLAQRRAIVDERGSKFAANTRWVGRLHTQFALLRAYCQRIECRAELAGGEIRKLLPYFSSRARQALVLCAVECAGAGGIAGASIVQQTAVGARDALSRIHAVRRTVHTGACGAKRVELRSCQAKVGSIQ